jgi:hypothetical protein
LLRIGISNGLWETRLTHVCPIGVVLDGLELGNWHLHRCLVLIQPAHSVRWGLAESEYQG